jgi:hydroxymethylbilane synthase
VTSMEPIRLGARTSPLARAQVALVGDALAARGVASTYIGVTTRGDVDGRPLSEIGGTGVFVGAVRDALRAGSIDVAVHSLKDLPTAPADDLEVVAIPEREDTRDVLIGCRLADLRDGARIGTGSPRRAMQLQDWAGRAGIELEVLPVRGNVDTRIGLVESGAMDAVVLAAAGLRRLGRLSVTEHGGALVSSVPAEILDHSMMLPAPGQGALALEISRSLSIERRSALAALNHPTARAESLAERGFLAGLEAGCTAPVGIRVVVTSVRGRALDLTLTAVIGRTLLSDVSEPPKTDPVLRFEASGTSAEPWDFGVYEAGQVLSALPDLPRHAVRPGAGAQQNARSQ